MFTFYFSIRYVDPKLRTKVPYNKVSFVKELKICIVKFKNTLSIYLPPYLRSAPFRRYLICDD